MESVCWQAYDQEEVCMWFVIFNSVLTVGSKGWCCFCCCIRHAASWRGGIVDGIFGMVGTYFWLNIYATYLEWLLKHQPPKLNYYDVTILIFQNTDVVCANLVLLVKINVLILYIRVTIYLIFLCIWVRGSSPHFKWISHERVIIIYLHNAATYLAN